MAESMCAEMCYFTTTMVSAICGRTYEIDLENAFFVRIMLPQVIERTWRPVVMNAVRMSDENRNHRIRSELSKMGCRPVDHT